MEKITSKLLKAILKTLEDKQGIDISVLKMDLVVSYTDYLVICNGTSNTHVNALVESIKDALSLKKEIVYQNRSLDKGWIVLDFVDVVVHIFLDETRKFYDLEGLWSDAQKVEFSEV